MVRLLAGPGAGAAKHIRRSLLLPTPALFSVLAKVLSVYKLRSSFGRVSHRGSRVVITLMMMMLIEMVIMFHCLVRKEGVHKRLTRTCL